MKANAFLQVPTGQASNIHSDTKVQFHLDQVQLLVIHEAELATYDAKELNCLNQVCREQFYVLSSYAVHPPGCNLLHGRCFLLSHAYMNAIEFVLIIVHSDSLILSLAS